MGTLDQVTQLKSQGMSEEEIVGNLQQQGVAPKEITDAINQAKIKGAVMDSGQAPSPEQAAPSPPNTAGTGGYTPQTQEVGDNAYVQPPEGGQQQYYEEGAYDQAPAAGAMDSSMIIEISNQVFSEKIKKIQNKLDDMGEFKTLAQTKIDIMEERLKRIEKMIDNLQIKILEEVGSYANELKKTKKEVTMIENTLTKKHTTTPIKKPISKKK